MKDYVIKVLTEDYAKEICSCQYEGDIDIYNFSEYKCLGYKIIDEDSGSMFMMKDI